MHYNPCIPTISFEKAVLSFCCISLSLLLLQFLTVLIKLLNVCQCLFYRLYFGRQFKFELVMPTQIFLVWNLYFNLTFKDQEKLLTE